MKWMKTDKKILFVVLFLLISIVGGTYAWFTYQSKQSALVLSIADLKDSKVIIKPYQIRENMSPVSIYTSGVYSQVQVINSSTSNKMIFVLNYKINSLSTELINNGLKYTIVSSTSENGVYTEISTGDFTSVSNENELVILDTKVEASTTTYYRVYLWLDSNYGNQVVIQNSILDVELNALIDREPISPVLDDGMIPVTISSDGTVTTILEDNDDWYNYQIKKWANIVLVKNSSRSNYLGTEDVVVSQSDILGYYVWIPRYRYKLWTTGVSNIGNVQSINIMFDSENTSIVLGTKVGEYRTHPAFMWDINNDGEITDNELLPGIWVGKFETSGTSVNPTVLPNVQSLRTQNVSSQFQTSLKFAGGTLSNGIVTFAGSDTYGLSSSMDSHMMKNSEWGAVAYLSHSKYGINQEIFINNSSSFYTGRSGGNVGGSTNTYYTYGYYTWLGQEITADGTVGNFVSNTTLGTNASTTGNVTGIYDMSGGTNEYVMSFLSDSNGKPLSGYDASSNSGFNGVIYDSGNNTEYTSGISFPARKYYDLYMTTSSITACNGKICYGHALSETDSWYGDYVNFVSSSNPLLGRGGYYDSDAGAGIFYLGNGSGVADSRFSWRSVLIPLELKPSTLTVSPTNLSITYFGSGTGYLTYTYDGDGIVSCSSSDTSVATCSVNSTNKKVTVSALSAGNSTITLSASVGIFYDAPESKTVSVTVSNATYTISYNACSGSGIPDNQIKIYGEPLTLSDITPSKDGYVFKGWSTSSCDATSATYVAGGSYTNNADATMYAVWEASDATPPTCTINATEGSTVLTVTYFDDSGLLSYYGWSSSYFGENSTTKTVDSLGTITYYVKDAAGNTGSCDGTVTATVDTTSCPAGCYKHSGYCATGANGSYCSEYIHSYECDSGTKLNDSYCWTS